MNKIQLTFSILLSVVVYLPTLAFSESTSENPFEKAERLEKEKRAIEGPTLEETVGWLNKNKHQITLVAGTWGNGNDVGIYGKKYASHEAKVSFSSCSVTISVERVNGFDLMYKDISTRINLGRTEPNSPRFNVATIDCDTYKYGECASTTYDVYDDRRRDADWEYEYEKNEYLRIPVKDGEYEGRVAFRFNATQYKQKYLDAFEHMKKLCKPKEKKDLF